MIIDSCIYFNEAELLQFRLRYLWDYVDKFIVVEADHTHSGIHKGFTLDTNEFEWARDKLIYGQVTYSIEQIEGVKSSKKPSDYQPDHPAWKLENFQRNMIIPLCGEFSGNDILMVSDCDEIPSHEVIDFRKNNSIQNPMSCQQQVSVYSLDYICPVDWRGTTIATLEYARKEGAQTMRDMRNRYATMPKAGWHLSYFGGAEQVKKKLEAFAHQEINKEEYTDMEKLNEIIKSGGAIIPGGTPCIKGEREYYPANFLIKAPDTWWL